MEHSKLGFIWFMNNTEISCDPHLIITQIRLGFHIYILEMSFCLLLYNITMIQHYSRCVIRQLLRLRISDTTRVVYALFRLGFYMSSLQELWPNWVMSNAPGRSALGSPRTYHARIPWQQTTSHPNVAQRYRADINDKVFPRDLYTMECHSIVLVNVHLGWL